VEDLKRKLSNLINNNLSLKVKKRPGFNICKSGPIFVIFVIADLVYFLLVMLLVFDCSDGGVA
jgi:hypothetical protein